MTRSDYLYPLIALFLIVLQPFTSFAITIKKEQEIAKGFIEKVKTYYTIIDDPEITGYMKGLGEKLLAQYPEQPFTYHLYVVKHDAFNAFAGPGGHIFIHSGLFEAIEKEEDLAGIIGHEISHVSCRHISERLDLQDKIKLSTIAGIAAGIFLGIYGDPTAGTALTVGAMAGGPAVSLAFSREDEMQADRIGLKYLNAAGFSGRGLIRSLNTLRGQQWFGKDQVPVYMNTHPALEDRMGYINNWVDTNEKHQTFSSENSFEFELAHTKLTATYGNTQKALKLYRKKLDQTPDDFFGNYGYGIALSRTGNTAKAIQFLKTALEKKAFHTGVLQTLGLLYYNSGEFEKSRNVFAGIVSIQPESFTSNLYYSRSLIETGELDKALDTIKNYAVEEIGNIKAFYCLADIYSRKQQFADSYYYLGLYYKGKKDYKNAVNQFTMALSREKDPSKKDKIVAQLNSMKRKKEAPDTITPIKSWMK